MEIKIRKCIILFNFSIIILILYSVFLKGYFPVKKGLSGFSQTFDVPIPGSATKNHEDDSSLPPRCFSRVILMVIDSLRDDFVFNGSMQFVNSLVDKGKALPFLAKAHPPTVTLPRIKAITTGDIPGFVDVVLNFGSSDLRDDNVLTQFKMANLTQVFFGDDTWISLFPEHFHRFDGTTSFFVTDYTEVDDNVTRHLDSELVNPDWDVMILHYLGLDHIGHLSGPTSPLIAPKLREMDAIVHKIYKAMEKWNEVETQSSLLVLGGDHGMSNQGGHGGASLEETIVPVILASPALISETKHPEAILQTDLAATLATVMGVPIPKNNLGQIISSSLIGYTVEDKVRAFQINAFQVSKILQQNIPNFERDDGYQLYEQTEKQHAKWLYNMKNNLSKATWDRFGHTLVGSYQHSVRQMASRISATSTTYDLYSMIIAVAYMVMVFIALCVLISAPDTFVYRISSNEMAAFGMCSVLGLIGHVAVCTSPHRSEFVCRTDGLSVLLQLIMISLFCGVCVLFFTYTMHYSLSLKIKSLNILESFLLIGTLMHIVSLLSSSFVEEEHQTWYFYSTTIHVMVLVKLIYKQIMHNTLVMGELSEQTSKQQSDEEETECTAQKCSQLEKDTKDSIFTEFQKDQHAYKNLSYSDSFYNDEADYIHNDEADYIQKEDTVTSDPSRSRITVKRSLWVAIVFLCVVLALLRILRTWNQTGDKWRHLTDVGDWLVRPENRNVLSGTVVLSMLCLVVTRCLHRSPFQASLFIWALICVYCFRAANGAVSFPGIYARTSKGTLEAQIAYVTIMFMMMEVLVTWIYYSIRQVQAKPQTAVVLWDRVQTIWLTLSVLLVRPHNTAVLAMLSVVEAVVSKQVVSVIKQPSFLLLYCFWMGEAAFFFQGNSNSLTSVDVTAGYAGLVDYQPLLIGLLMFASTYAGPVFWLLSFFKYSNTQQLDQQLETYSFSLKCSYRRAAHTLLLTQTLTLVVYTIMVTIERYHLFVWTVFSPKLLYEGTKTVVVSLFSWMLLLLSDFTT